MKFVLMITMSMCLQRYLLANHAESVLGQIKKLNAFQILTDPNLPTVSLQKVLKTKILLRKKLILVLLQNQKSM